MTSHRCSSPARCSKTSCCSPSSGPCPPTGGPLSSGLRAACMQNPRPCGGPCRASSIGWTRGGSPTAVALEGVRPSPGPADDRREVVLWSTCRPRAARVRPLRRRPAGLSVGTSRSSFPTSTTAFRCSSIAAAVGRRSFATVAPPSSPRAGSATIIRSSRTSTSGRAFRRGARAPSPQGDGALLRARDDDRQRSLRTSRLDAAEPGVGRGPELEHGTVPGLVQLLRTMFSGPWDSDIVVAPQGGHRCPALIRRCRLGCLSSDPAPT